MILLPHSAPASTPGHVTFFWNGNRSGYLDPKLEKFEEVKFEGCSQLLDGLTAGLPFSAAMAAAASQPLCHWWPRSTDASCSPRCPLARRFYQTRAFRSIRRQP